MPTSVKLMDVVALYRDAILGSTAIATFCTTNFSKALTLYVGLNDEAMPGESESPFVVLFPEAKDSGVETDMFLFNFSIVAAISDTEFSDFHSVGASEWRGLYRIDEFVHLIETALINASDGYNIQPDIVNFDMIEMSYPLAVATMAVTARLPNVIGGTIGLT